MQAVSYKSQVTSKKIKERECNLLKTCDSRLMTENGFTLIEVMLTIAVLSIGTIFVLQAFTGQITALGIGYDTIRATFLLEEKMADIEEEIRLEGNLNRFFPSGHFDISREKTFSWNLTALPSEIDEELTETQLSCFWYSKGKMRNINMTTLVREVEDE